MDKVYTFEDIEIIIVKIQEFVVDYNNFYNDAEEFNKLTSNYCDIREQFISQLIKIDGIINSIYECDLIIHNYAVRLFFNYFFCEEISKYSVDDEKCKIISRLMFTTTRRIEYSVISIYKNYEVFITDENNIYNRDNLFEIYEKNILNFFEFMITYKFMYPKSIHHDINSDKHKNKIPYAMYLKICSFIFQRKDSEMNTEQFLEKITNTKLLECFSKKGINTISVK